MKYVSTARVYTHEYVRLTTAIIPTQCNNEHYRYVQRLQQDDNLAVTMEQYKTQALIVYYC